MTPRALRLVMLAALLFAVLLGPFSLRAAEATTYKIIDLGTLGGANSMAVAVNATGQVVGLSDNTTGALRGFSWTAAGGMVDLGTFGGSLSSATALNDSGQVVGYAY